MFQQVLIIGVGLLGGSLALALRKRGLAQRVFGCSRSKETVLKALKLDIIHAGSTAPTDFVREADLIVFALPLSAYAELAEAVSGLMKPNAILTDVGSVKRCVVDDMLPHLSAKQRSLFVPGHPIAGSDSAGPESSTEMLFDGRQVILTPVEQTNKTICNQIETMWTKLGARIGYMTPEKHDMVFAHVSHAVQFLAYVYRLAFPEQIHNSDEAFRRFFRIARSDSRMWIDIFRANKDNVLKALERFRIALIKEMEKVDAAAALPLLVAQAVDDMGSEFKLHAGSGFADFTSPLASEVACDQTISDTSSFLAMFDTLKDALKNDKLDAYLPSRSS